MEEEKLEDSPIKDDNNAAVSDASQPKPQLHSPPPAEEPATTTAADLVARWHMQTYGNTSLDFRNAFAPTQMSAFGSPNLSQFVSSRQREGSGNATSNNNNKGSSRASNKIGGGTRSSLDPSQLSQFSATSSKPAKPSSDDGNGSESATAATTTTLMPKAKAATLESARDILKSLSNATSSSNGDGGGDGGRDK